MTFLIPFPPIRMTVFLWPYSHSHPIPIVVYESIPIPSRDNILIPIPSHSLSRTWYSKFRTSYDYLE